MPCRRLTLECLCVVLLLGSSANGSIVTFGSSTHQFDVEFVQIGSPGNVDDSQGDPGRMGNVDYIYWMGKFEVSRGMITKANEASGLDISLADMGSYGGNGVNRPATGVTWNEAARFVNWLNTNQGFAPAYRFSLRPGEAGYDPNADIERWMPGDPGFDASNPFRNRLANYVLPSYDEWHKAAYFDPASDRYFEFPTEAGVSPSAVSSGTVAGTAVFHQYQPANVMQAGGLTAFGVMGMAANVWEWEETELDVINDSPSSNRGVRGGDWSGDAGPISASTRYSFRRNEGNAYIGFRVASLSNSFAIPEPSTCGIWSILAASYLSILRRRDRD